MSSNPLFISKVLPYAVTAIFAPAPVLVMYGISMEKEEKTMNGIPQMHR